MCVLACVARIAKSSQVAGVPAGLERLRERQLKAWLEQLEASNYVHARDFSGSEDDLDKQETRT
jgi:hypothetical protein